MNWWECAGEGIKRMTANQMIEVTGGHISSGDAGDRVGCARAGSDQCHADLVAGTRVSISGMHRGLLVADQYMLELLLTENCVIYFEYRAAGVAEYEFDSFFLQAANYDLRARYLHFCLFVFQVIFVP